RHHRGRASRKSWASAVGQSRGRRNTAATARIHHRDGTGRRVASAPVDPLLTDLYEFTMAAALVAEGRADEPATFSLFVRNLPPSRGYLVAAGLHDAARFLREWRFDEDALARLRRTAPFDPAFLEWLGDLRFTGRVRAVPEGRVVFAAEPLIEVDGPFGAGQLLETILL